MGTTPNYRPQYEHGTFVDYKGRERHFILCALSMPCFNCDGVYHVMDKDTIDTNETVIKRFNDAMKMVSEELFNTGFIEIKRPKLENPVCGVVVREIRIGVALLRADETFNEELGQNVAYGKALKSDLKMWVSDMRLISNSSIQALLKQQAEYVIENPDEYIKGYAEEHLKAQVVDEGNSEIETAEPINISACECKQESCCNCKNNMNCTNPNIEDVEYVEIKD